MSAVVGLWCAAGHKAIAHGREHLRAAGLNLLQCGDQNAISTTRLEHQVRDVTLSGAGHDLHGHTLAIDHDKVRYGDSEFENCFNVSAAALMIAA